MPRGISHLNPAQRTQRARIAALTRWANDDGKATGAAAQAGLRRKFYDQTDPALPEAQRQVRAERLYRAHMARLSFLAAKAREARKATGD